jgi:hypothetical protein
MELLAPAVPEVGASPEFRRFLSPRLVGPIIAAGVVLAAAAGLPRSGRPFDRHPTLAIADSTPAVAEVAYHAAAAARLNTVRAAPVPAASPGEILVARTWTHVRQSRSRDADVAAVLLPGDTVVADSLARGWYRVALEGEVLGYVHRSTLTRP